MEFLLIMPIYFVLIGGTFWIGELLLSRDNLLIADRLSTGHWGGRHDWNKDQRNPNDGTMQNRLNLWLFDMLNRSVGNSAIVTEVKQGRVMRHPKYSWSQTVGSRTSIWQPQPEWTAGWLHGKDDSWRDAVERARNVTATNVAPPALLDDVFGMNANISEYDFLNVSLMRTKLGETGYRSWKPAKLCHECTRNSCSKWTCMGGIPVFDSVWYEKVYEEKFPLHSPSDLKNSLSSKNADGSKADCGENDHSDYTRFPTFILWGQ